jgi:DNA (cytosine-5)-methyltransferase 1
MRDLGYEVTVEVLDATNFGVPQHRSRLFFNRVGADNPEMKAWASHRQPTSEAEQQMKFNEDPTGRTETDQETLGKYASGDPEPRFPHFGPDRDETKP